MPHSKTRFWQNPATLLLVFLIVVAVRFDRNGFLVKRNLHDAAFYISNVEFFRGDKISHAFMAPFNERLLVTFVASFLPVRPMTAINIVNVVFILASIYFLYRSLLLFNLSKDFVWAGLYLFILSFPTFYYSTIGYIDSGVLLMIFMGMYATFTGRYLLFLIAIALGAFAKEGVVVLIPFALAYGFTKNQKTWYAYSFAGLLVYLLVWGLVKFYVPNSHGDTPVLFWQPDTWRIKDNFTRINAYLSSIWSFGIPGLLILYYWIYKKKNLLARWKQDLPLWVGTLGGYALWFYTLFSAHTDGRFFWVTYCFPIILTMIWAQEFGFTIFGKVIAKPAENLTRPSSV